MLFDVVVVGGLWVDGRLEKALADDMHTVPEWAESLKNCSLGESGFALKSTLLESRISRSRQNLLRAFLEKDKKVDF